ncbi:hypothetical protein C1645_782130 [Glomus cerebriforme]|uniref:Uncharacterized protein n=1 Tax=Glomus cerebriforme TaxID=658196 RepID=A0A397SML5_9GLOM|nr:hypothetical protein C1645_782130 [Glomus cerebriforme]
MKQIKKFKRSHPYKYNQYNYSTSYSNQRNFATIPEAKRAGAIDRIEDGETKLKLITLFQENMNYINLTEIPQKYFLRFGRALEYTGKFKYRMNDEMPNILTQYESGDNKEIIIRLSEPYQKIKCDILSKIDQDLDDYEVHQNREQSVEIVEEWLNKQKRTNKEEEGIMQNDKGEINLRVVFDEDDLNYISPLQRDVLEFLLKEF